MYLEGAEGSSAHAVADAVRAVLFPVASAAVDFFIRAVVQIGRIQGTVAGYAVEAATMPDSVFADHLLGGVDAVVTAGAAFSILCLQAQFLGKRGVGLGAIDGDESGRVAVTESFRSELFSVAGLAVDFLVGSVAGQHRIQGSFAVVALEAEFVVFAAFRQHLLGSKDHSSAAGTALTLLRLDGFCVDVDERRFLAVRNGVALKEG